MRHRNLSSPLPHYLIVLNVNADADEVVVLSVITSQIEKCRKRAALRGYVAGTLVECSPNDYFPLGKPSMIDCNSCLTAPARLFRQDVSSVTRCASISPSLLARILEGVRLSKTGAEIKKLLGL